jgi:hypothetical protein
MLEISIVFLAICGLLGIKQGVPGSTRIMEYIVDKKDHGKRVFEGSLAVLSFSSCFILSILRSIIAMDDPPEEFLIIRKSCLELSSLLQWEE